MFVGVDIGGTKTAVSFSSQPPRILWRGEFATEPHRGPEHALQKIVSHVRDGIAALGGTASDVQGIGVSCGGPLDRAQGVIQRPPNLPTWDGVPVKARLEAEFGVPCLVENDANAGAVAEHRFGAGAGCRHMVFLTMGTGLGGGLILNGRLFRGASEMAGEIGHVRLTPSGPWGYGKAGSAEGWASGAGMVQHARERIREAVVAGESTVLADQIEELTARHIGMAAQAGDAVADRIVRETGTRLGDALAILVDVLNPERIVIGGLAMRFGERLLEPARERIMAEALTGAARVCSVVPAALGEKIGDIAALCVAMDLDSQTEPAEMSKNWSNGGRGGF